MIENMQTYFKAEKAESLIFMGVGVFGILLCLYLFFTYRNSFNNGLMIPVIGIGLIAIVVGGSVYFRTDQQMEDLASIYQKDVTAYKAQELPRMDVVNKNFDIYKVVEIAFILIGVTLIFFFQKRDFLLGLGLGMLLEGTFMLSADIFAEKRADLYTEQIQAIG